MEVTSYRICLVINTASPTKVDLNFRASLEESGKYLINYVGSEGGGEIFSIISRPFVKH